jgi:hypothetical protein
MKRLFTALVLTVIVSAPSLAGEIPIGDFVPPPPQTNVTQSFHSQSQLTTPPQDVENDSELLSELLLSIVSLLVR